MNITATSFLMGLAIGSGIAALHWMALRKEDDECTALDRFFLTPWPDVIAVGFFVLMSLLLGLL